MNITPPHLRCGMGSCPSVHVLEDGRLEVRGELVVIHETLAKAASHEVKTAEATVVIPAEYFSALPELVRLREENERLREALGCQAEVTAVGERSSNTACSLQTDLSAEAVEAIVTDVMDECSVNMRKCFATGKDEMAEAFRLRLEGAARVAQKLGMLRPDEERASAMSAHSKEAGGLTPQDRSDCDPEPAESTQDG